MVVGICSQKTMNEYQMCFLRVGDPIKNTQTAVVPKVMNPALKAPATLTSSLMRLSSLKPHPRKKHSSFFHSKETIGTILYTLNYVCVYLCSQYFSCKHVNFSYHLECRPKGNSTYTHESDIGGMYYNHCHNYYLNYRSISDIKKNPLMLAGLLENKCL